MKKFLKSFVFCFAFILFLSGCSMKAEYGINIDSKKNVSVEVISAMDDELIDSLLSSESVGESEENKTYTDEDRWKYVDENISDDDYEGYTKVKYDKNGYKGYSFKKDLGNIDDLSSDDPDDVELGDINDDSKIFIKKDNVYTLKVKNDSENEEQMEEYNESVGFDVKLVVTLPNEAISNNATEVSSDGLTYTWDLVKAKDIELSFSFDKNNKGNNTVVTTKKPEGNNTEVTTKKSGETNTTGENKETEEEIKKGVSSVLKYVLIGGAIFLGVVVIIIIIVVIASKGKKKNAQVDPMNNYQPTNNYQPVNNYQPEQTMSNVQIGQNIPNEPVVQPEQPIVQPEQPIVQPEQPVVNEPQNSDTTITDQSNNDQTM